MLLIIGLGHSYLPRKIFNIAYVHALYEIKSECIFKNITRIYRGTFYINYTFILSVYNHSKQHCYRVTFTDQNYAATH